MAGLLPSSPDTSGVEDAEPRVIGIEGDDADALIGALSSETARSLLAALHDEPATPSAVAARVDTSLQNAQYHLGKLEAADLIREVGTAYSEKGREMTVYAPADAPLVVVAGNEEATSGLRTALSRLLGAVAALGVGSVVVEQLLGDGVLPGDLGVAEDDVAEDPVVADEEVEDSEELDEEVEEPEATEEDVADDAPTDDVVTPEEAPMPEVGVVDLGDATLGLPPGALFFLGGLVVIACLFALGYSRY
ncbi:ArsR/SmtB family transcription factor [Natronorarus salvus]|uniref:ArsR/SmtB family transcription factor n=1 Tax=Natronorarus salvus TaxID=3117733 RepID=UPI002F265E40